MKTSVVLSTVLLAGAAACGAATDEEDLDQASDEARARTELINDVYETKETFADHTYEVRPGQDPIRHDVRVKYRMKFIKAKDYDLDGRANRGLDYEVVIETVVQGTGETIGTDSYYYAKRDSASKYRLFDCDSTRRCRSDSRVTSMSLSKNGGAATLRVKTDDATFFAHDENKRVHEITLVKVK